MPDDRSLINGRQSNMLMLLPVTLAAMIAGVSLVGIFSPDFYAKETLNWQVQSVGQDIVDLVLVVPVLLVATMTSFLRRKPGISLLGGVLVYVVYTFVIYCFDVHFNKLFIFYCAILGLAFYLFLYFIYNQLRDQSIRKIENTFIRKFIGIYFVIVAVVFYFLWLSDLIPSVLSNSTPTILVEAGLPTNPVHVIDLSIFLPGIFITGILLMKNHKLGLILTPVMLVFFILMEITIGALSAMMLQKGLDGSLALTGVMGAMAFLSLVLLIWCFRSAESGSD